jgi:tetratricopeptide (TPR) repeat protein
MKKSNQVLKAALIAAGLTGAACSLVTANVAVAADKKKDEPQQKVSAAVGKPLKAAQEALQAKNWDAALVAINEAKAIEGKTPYETYMTNEMEWFVLLQQKKYPEAATVLEAQYQSGMIPAADLPARLKALTQLSYQNKAYDKAIDYGGKYLATTPNDTDIATLVATSYYMKNDFAGARTAAQKLIASSSGKPPEALLQLQLRTNVELNDRPGTLKALEDMIRYYPDKKYWEDLLNAHLFMQNSERDLRALFRLMQDTDTMDKPDEFAEAASVMVAGGFPTEAQHTIEEGMAANVFQGESKQRAQEEFDRAKSGAVADKKELPGADAALAAAKTGTQMVATGKLFFSVGDYAKAAKAIQQGLAKGGVADTDDANALLGVALARSNDTAGAATAFSAVKDARLSQIAGLWKLHLDTKSMPATAAAPAPTDEESAETGSSTSQTQQ